MTIIVRILRVPRIILPFVNIRSIKILERAELDGNVILSDFCYVIISQIVISEIFGIFTFE